MWGDGIYVKAGLEDEKAALLVLVGALGWEQSGADRGEWSPGIDRELEPGSEGSQGARPQSTEAHDCRRRYLWGALRGVRRARSSAAGITRW